MDSVTKVDDTTVSVTSTVSTTFDYDYDYLVSQVAIFTAELQRWTDLLAQAKSLGTQSKGVLNAIAPKP